MTTPAYDIDGMAWQLRRVYHFTTTDCTPGTCKGRDCMRMSHLDDAGFRAVTELAWRIAEKNLPAAVLTDRELRTYGLYGADHNGLQLVCGGLAGSHGTFYSSAEDPVILGDLVGAVVEHRAAHL